MRYSINLIWSEEDKRFLAAIPELPGCFADGETQEEALENIREVAAEWIGTATQLGRAVPEPVDVARAQKLNQEALRQAQEQFEALKKGITGQIQQIIEDAQNQASPRLSSFPIGTRTHGLEPA